MFANILLATLVTSVITIVALGHVLLVVALWPDPKAGPYRTSMPSMT